MSSFFIEDQDQLLRAYPQEDCLPYPFSDSPRRIPYVLCLGAEAADAEATLDAEIWTPSADIVQATAEGFERWRRASGAVLGPRATSVRLSDIGRGGALTLQPVRYEDYARTNLMADYPARPSLREREQGMLAPLAESALANPVGVNVLALNVVGEIPLQVRAQSTALRPGMICSTGSGALDIEDIPARQSRVGDWRLMRELEEEMGAALAARLGAPRVLGVARELARGGQPELFVVAEGDFTREDVLKSMQAAGAREVQGVVFLQLPRVGERFDAAGAARAIADLEQVHGRDLAAPLRAHLSLLLRELAETGRLS